MKHWRKITGGSFLVLLFLFSLIPTNPSSAAQKNDDTWGVLEVTQINPPPREVCRGTTLRLFFFVIDKTNWVNPPESGATVGVTSSDSTGVKVQLINTNKAGVAIVDWKLNEVGTKKFTVQAEKQMYTPATPLTLTYEVVTCYWQLNIFYLEHYYVINEGDAHLAVGAKVDWTVNLRPFLDEKVKLVPWRESGNYVMFATTLTEGTATARLDPAPFGNYSIKVLEKSEAINNILFLDLQSVPIKYPATVTMKVTNAGEYHTKVPENAPVATHPTEGKFLEVNERTMFTLPISGAFKFYEYGKCVFFCSSKPGDILIHRMSVSLRRLTEAEMGVLGEEIPVFPWDMTFAFSGDRP